MSWRKWKMGLVVAGLSAICDGVIVAFADPNIALRALAIVLVVMMAKAMGLYLKKHPVEEVSSDTEILRRATMEAAGRTEVKGLRTEDLGRKVLGLAAMMGVLVLASGCVGSGAAKVFKELAKDQATVSLRIRVGTPYGIQEFDMTRVGGGSNTVYAGSGTVSVNAPKKAQSSGE